MSNLRFGIIYCSGEDDGCPVSELLHPSATSKGYATPKYCEYPQSIIIQLESGKARVTQIQLLSHENKIAQRIVLYYATENVYEECQFIRIGHVRLNSNEGSEYKARELKTIHIDNEATFLKFEIIGCYNNIYNLYSQASILAISIFGEPLEIEENALETDDCFVPNGTTFPLGTNTNTSFSQKEPNQYPIVDIKAKATPTPMDDLSFDMRFDPATAQKIREIHLAKERAVQMEDYDQAKKLKTYEDHLKSIGIQLARLDLQKKAAINNEDYDLAKKIKIEMESLSASDTFKDTIRSSNVTSQQLPMKENLQQSQPFLPSRTLPRDEDMGPPVAPLTRDSSKVFEQTETNRIPTTSGSNFLSSSNSNISLNASASLQSLNRIALDDSLHSSTATDIPRNEPLPNASQEKIASSGYSASGYNGAEGLENLPLPDELPDSLRNESQEMIAVMGEYLVRCFYSAAAILRSSAIKKFLTDLDKIPGNRQLIFNVGCSLVDGGMTDRNADIFVSSSQLLLRLLDYAIGVPSEDIATRTDRIITALMNKIGDGKPKSKDSPAEVLRQLARHRLVGPQAVAHALLSVPKRTLNAKVLQGRLIVLQGLISEIGCKSDIGLAPEGVITFLQDTNSFSHIQPEVRDAAKEVTVSIFKHIGYAIEALLKPYLKEKQAKEYHDAFEKADSSFKSPSTKVHENPRISGDIQEDDDGGYAEDEVPPDECQFCHCKDPSFVNENNADRHYWSECPMLIPCRSCEQVIEIADLNHHLIEECDMKDKHKLCPRCGEAINIEFFNAHTGRRDCIPKKDPSKIARCPLCHDDFPMVKNSWFEHLVENKCPMNPRTK